MKVVYPDQEQNELLSAWLSKRLGGGLGGQCLAIMDDARLVGVVAFFNFRWPNIEVAFLCEDYRWALNREGIREVLSYPFRQLDCRRITALIERKNMRARKMVQRLGFIEEGKLRKAGEHGDIIVYGLLPEDFRLGKDRETAKSAATA